MKDYSEAERLAKKGVEIYDPKMSWSYLLIMGKILFVQKKYDDALVQFKKGLAIDPKNLFGLTHYAKVLLSKNQLKDAALKLKKRLR